MFDSPAPMTTGRFFPETGCTVDGAFLAFLDHYGLVMCGLPLTDRLNENGVSTQYFERLALTEPTPGQVQLKALGSELLALREASGGAARVASPPAPADHAVAPPSFPLLNQVWRLPRHASARYSRRSLADIRHLIIHHTGVPASVGAEIIAGYHVTDLNWPGIGYHFVIDPEGRIAQTNALTTVANHARQYNLSGVGIALQGNFEQATPTAAQLDATALVCAWLERELGLSPDCIKGHRELVAVTCPGDLWLQGPRWRDDLVTRVAHVLNGGTLPMPEPPRHMEAVAVAVEPAPNGFDAPLVPNENGPAPMEQPPAWPAETTEARVADTTPPEPPSWSNPPPSSSG